MSVNPIITEGLVYKAQLSAFTHHSHKLSIYGVYDWQKPVKEEVFDEMRMFCAEYHITFSLRPFSPHTRQEDRNEISKLPAYQMYYNNHYEKTAYPHNGVRLLKELVLSIEAETSTRRGWFFMLNPFTIPFRFNLKKEPSLTKSPLTKPL